MAEHAAGAAVDVEQVYGFDPRDRAARSWLWHVEEDGRLVVIASSAHSFESEPNYDGNDGPMVGGEEYARHRWRPLEAGS